MAVNEFVLCVDLFNHNSISVMEDWELVNVDKMTQEQKLAIAPIILLLAAAIINFGSGWWTCQESRAGKG